MSIYIFTAFLLRTAVVKTGGNIKDDGAVQINEWLGWVQN